MVELPARGRHPGLQDSRFRDTLPAERFGVQGGLPDQAGWNQGLGLGSRVLQRVPLEPDSPAGPKAPQQEGRNLLARNLD